MRIVFEDSNAWVDILTTLEWPVGQPAIVYNSSAHPVIVTILPDGEIPNFGYDYTISSLQHAVLTPADGKTIWVKAYGEVLVEPSFPSMIMALSAVDLPADVWTSGLPGMRRLQVDPGQTSLYEGREFRVTRKISVTAGTPLIYRFTSAVDFIFQEQVLGASVGDIELHTYAGSQVTPGGTPTNRNSWIRAKNTSGEYRNYSGARYATQMTLDVGGTVTYNTGQDDYADYDRAKVAAATAQQQAVGGSEFSVRYLAAGSYYVVITSLDATSTGRIHFAWEERPPEVQTLPI